MDNQIADLYKIGKGVLSGDLVEEILNMEGVYEDNNMIYIDEYDPQEGEFDFEKGSSSGFPLMLTIKDKVFVSKDTYFYQGLNTDNDFSFKEYKVKSKNVLNVIKGKDGTWGLYKGGELMYSPIYKADSDFSRGYVEGFIECLEEFVKKYDIKETKLKTAIDLPEKFSEL